MVLQGVILITMKRNLFIAISITVILIFADVSLLRTNISPLTSSRLQTVNGSNTVMPKPTPSPSLANTSGQFLPSDTWSSVKGLPTPTGIMGLIVSNGYLYTWGGSGVWSWDGSSWTLLKDGTEISTLYAADNGKVYAGTLRGDVLTWNGVSWSNLGSITKHIIRSFCISRGVLYAGTDQGVYSWNGSSWSQVGTLIGNAQWALSLVSFDNSLYVGTGNGVWLWNGFFWVQVGGLTGNASQVKNLTRSNNKLYAATKDGVWVWTGFSWSSVGDLTGKSITSLIMSNDKLYAGVDAPYVSDTPPEPGGLGVWSSDGSSWSQLGSLAGEVTGLVTVNGILYASTLEGVWSWDGSSWSRVNPAGYFPEYGIDNFLLTSGKLYAGTEGGVWTWDGNSWSEVGNLSNTAGIGLLGVGTMAIYDGKLYVGILAGSGYPRQYRGIWTWDGSSWSQVEGLPEEAACVSSLVTLNGMLYAGTGYGAIGAHPRSEGDGLWSWNGSSWTKAATLPNDVMENYGGGNLFYEPEGILCLAVADGVLYAGTDFDGIWSLKGSRWSQVGNDQLQWVYNLVAANGQLYAASGDPAGGDGIYCWDGSSWKKIKSPPDYNILLTSVNNDLYAGTNKGVWSWNGSSWSQVGNTIGDGTNIDCLAEMNGVLYAGTGNGIFAIKLPRSKLHP